jgi:tRNA pseudouridine38-40 synthase
MARYKVILTYDGTHFKGFQRQGTERTVQAEVEKALRGLGWTGRAILSAGRTDSGVHAAGQVVTFDLAWEHPLEDLLNALNANLPGDVAVTEISRERDDFHPRFDAVERSYRYRIYVQPVRDPLRERYAWRVWPEPRMDLLAEAALRLPGSHDFAAFGCPQKPAGSTIRFIYTAGWEREGDELVFSIRGNAFLYHMVRRLVYAQIQVGQERWRMETFESAVETAQALAPGLAPAQGLTLMSVRCAGSRQEAERQMQTLL